MQPLRVIRDQLWARVGYEPYAQQLRAHDCAARIRLIAGGERAGKSRSAAMELVGRFLQGRLFWLVGPDYDLCRPEFSYLVEALGSLDAIETLAAPTGQSSRMTLRNGATIATRTGQRALRLAGQAPDGILGCEAAQLSYDAFLRLSGRLAERRGWMWLSGTFEGSRGWYAEKYRAWQADNPDDAGGRTRRSSGWPWPIRPTCSANASAGCRVRRCRWCSGSFIRRRTCGR